MRRISTSQLEPKITFSNTIAMTCSTRPYFICGFLFLFLFLKECAEKNCLVCHGEQQLQRSKIEKIRLELTSSSQPTKRVPDSRPDAFWSETRNVNILFIWYERNAMKQTLSIIATRHSHSCATFSSLIPVLHKVT